MCVYSSEILFNCAVLNLVQSPLTTPSLCPVLPESVSACPWLHLYLMLFSFNSFGVSGLWYILNCFCSENRGSGFIFLRMDIQFSQYHLLETTASLRRAFTSVEAEGAVPVLALLLFYRLQLLLLLWLPTVTYGQVLQYLQPCFFSTDLLWLLRVTGVSIRLLRSFFLTLWKMPSKLWAAESLCMTFGNIVIFYNITFVICECWCHFYFLCLLQSPSSVVHYRGLSPSCLCLFQGCFLLSFSES